MDLNKQFLTGKSQRNNVSRKWYKYGDNLILVVITIKGEGDSFRVLRKDATPGFFYTPAKAGVVGVDDHIARYNQQSIRAVRKNEPIDPTLVQDLEWDNARVRDWTNLILVSVEGDEQHGGIRIRATIQLASTKSTFVFSGPVRPTLERAKQAFWQLFNQQYQSCTFVDPDCEVDDLGDDEIDINLD